MPLLVTSLPCTRESILIADPQVQSFVSPAASRLLFGMTAGILPFAATRPASLFAPLLRRSAQKITKKARHRTRIVRAPLRAFSAEPCDARRRERRRLRTKPCIPALRRYDPSLLYKPGVSAIKTSARFCGRMPPKWGPCGAARVRRKSPKEGAQDARQFVARTRMCAQRTP
jgi:hypothetical protein